MRKAEEGAEFAATSVTFTPAVLSAGLGIQATPSFKSLLSHASAGVYETCNTETIPEELRRFVVAMATPNSPYVLHRIFSASSEFTSTSGQYL